MACKRRSRHSPPRSPAAVPTRCSRREADTLALVAAGLANSTIAEQLYVSVRTVESHVSSLLANSTPGTEPSSPLATWNGSEMK